MVTLDVTAARRPFHCSGARPQGARYLAVSRADGQALRVEEYTGAGGHRTWLRDDIHAALVSHVGGPVCISHVSTRSSSIVFELQAL